MALRCGEWPPTHTTLTLPNTGRAASIAYNWSRTSKWNRTSYNWSRTDYKWGRTTYEWSRTAYNWSRTAYKRSRIAYKWSRTA